MEGARILPRITANNSGLVQLNYRTAFGVNEPEFEDGTASPMRLPRASEHWRFNHGDDDNLGGGLNGLLLTPKVGEFGIRSVTVTNGGTGYTSAPTCTAASGSATFRVILNGTTVEKVQVRAAGSYPSGAPSLSFSGGGGSGAAATPVLDGRPTHTADEIVTRDGGINGLNTIWPDAGTFTIAGVFRVPTLSGNDGQVIFGNALEGDSAGARAYFTNSGNMSWRVYGDSLKAVTGATDLAPGDRYFMALSKYGTGYKAYLGGSTLDDPPGITLVNNDELMGLGNSGFSIANAYYGKGVAATELMFWNGIAFDNRQLGLLYIRRQSRLAAEGITIR